MMSDWRAVLQQAGASFEGDTTRDFGHPEAELGAAGGELIAPLTHFALVQVAGEEAATFLQGQATNDTRKATPELSQLSAFCTPKGRVLVNFRLFRRADGFWLRLPRELLESTVKRLRMYVLRAKVTVAPMDDYAALGIAGTQAAQWLATALQAPLPAEPDGSATFGEVTVIRVPGDRPRFEIYAPVAAVRALWESRPDWLRPVGGGVWQLEEIRAGLPQIYAASSEQFVPQMINLQLVEGVSFQKGCYTGQEIVARMQYLGKLKRRMYLAHAQGTDLPAPGAELFAAGSASGQGPGNVVEACRSPAGGIELLAVIERSAVDANEEVRLYNAEGPKLVLRPLPYAFPADA